MLISITIIYTFFIPFFLNSCQEKEELIEEHTFLIEELHNSYHLNYGYTFDETVINENKIEEFYENSLFLDSDIICPKLETVFIYSKDIDNFIDDNTLTYYKAYYKKDYGTLRTFIISDGCTQQIYNDSIIVEVIKKCKLKI